MSWGGQPNEVERLRKENERLRMQLAAALQQQRPASPSPAAIRVLTCFDGFKETLSADDVSVAVSGALQERYGPSVHVSNVSLSDGGGGFLDAMTPVLGLQTVCQDVLGPLGQRLPGGALYGLSQDRSVAVVEMARASGLHQVPPAQRNPLHTTTHGVGQLIRAALDSGASRILVGLGGSATNDGGLGALHALGLRIRLRGEDETQAGDWLADDEPFFGRDLSRVLEVQWPAALVEKLAAVQWEAACDVTNPFIGPRGAVAVYGEQKFDPKMAPDVRESDAQLLESGMQNVAAVFQAAFDRDVRDFPGAGAAGGLAGGLWATLGMSLRSGIDLVAEARHLRAAVADADLILTGEGRFDEQSLQGKVVQKVLQLGQSLNRPVVVLCGQSRGMPVAVWSCSLFAGTRQSLSRPASVLHDLILSPSFHLPLLDIPIHVENAEDV